MICLVASLILTTAIAAAILAAVRRLFAQAHPIASPGKACPELWARITEGPALVFRSARARRLS